MKPALFIGRTLEAFLDDVLVPWFSDAGIRAIRSRVPSVVVLPSHSTAARIRELLSSRGVPALGVRFWTPVDLRRHLASASGTRLLEDVADRQLILRSAAEEVFAASPGNAAASAIAASAGSLSSTIDIVEAGGWSADVIGGDDVRSVINLRGERMASAGVVTPNAFSFKTGDVLPLEHVLIAGFSGAHWTEWGTLSTAAKAAKTVTVLLTSPRRKGEALDMTWIASWESFGGSVRYVEEQPGQYSNLAARFDELPNMTGSADEADVSFVYASDFEDEARRALAAASKALANDAARVAIIVPQQGPLALELARQAQILDLPHYNGVPASVTDPVRSTSIARLLSFLAEPNAEFLLSLSVDCILLQSATRPPKNLRKYVEREASNFLFGDARLLAESLIEQGDVHSLQTGKFIEMLCVWEKASTVGAYLNALSELLLKLGAPLRSEILRVIDREKHFANVTITRAGMAAWLLAKLREQEPARSDTGSHRFARLHILLPRDAASLSWDHVVLTGQNEGVWPPPAHVCPYLGDDALRSLNQQVYVLNQEAVVESNESGIGAVRDGHALCLSPGLERTLVLRDFSNLLENCGGMTLTASRVNPTKPGNPAYPGEIFSRLFQLITGKTVSKSEGNAVSGHFDLAAELFPSPERKGIEQMLLAREARRTMQGPSEFEYSLKSAPDWDVTISCSEWDKVATSPASVFLKAFCGVRSSQNVAEEMAWKKVAGVWVHGWIEKVAGHKPTRLTEDFDWKNSIKAESELFRRRISTLLEKHGRKLPAWWTSLWHVATGQAQQFAQSLSSVRGYEYVQSEIVIPRTEVEIIGGGRLPINGRIDLAFFDRLSPAEGGFKDCSVLALDFKTGSHRGLKVENLRKGEAVQLPLYALSIDALGAKNVGICLLKPGEAAEIQMSIEDVKKESDLWCEFSRLLRTGTFGRLESYRSEFGFSPDFPIACLEPKSEFTPAKVEKAA